MPTIDLTNNQQTNTTPSTQAPVAPVQPSSPAWNDPWGAPWGGDDRPSAGSAPKRMSPQERVTMIENIYSEVLGRKPDTRDINYYKYSTLSEDEIKKQLLTGNEHKQLLLDGRDYKKAKDRALQAETRVKILEGQIKDQVEEFKQLTNLLKEKNRYIQELREKINTQYHTHPFQNPDTIEVETVKLEPVQDQQTHFVTPVTSPDTPSAAKSKVTNILDRFKDAVAKLS